MRATVSLPGHRVLLVPAEMEGLVEKGLQGLLGLVGSGVLLKWTTTWLKSRKDRRTEGLALEVRVFDEAADLRKEAYAREKDAFDQLAREREARHQAEMRACVAEHSVAIAARDAVIVTLTRRLTRMSGVLDSHAIAYVEPADDLHHYAPREVTNR